MASKSNTMQLVLLTEVFPINQTHTNVPIHQGSMILEVHSTPALDPLLMAPTKMFTRPTSSRPTDADPPSSSTAPATTSTQPRNATHSTPSREIAPPVTTPSSPLPRAAASSRPPAHRARPWWAWYASLTSAPPPTLTAPAPPASPS